MSFTRADYHTVYSFARKQYFWHESTGRGFDTEAAVIMEMCEDVVGQQSNFPIEARERLKELPRRVIAKIKTKLAEEAV
jgi:hypothetical protein